MTEADEIEAILDPSRPGAAPAPERPVPERTPPARRREPRLWQREFPYLLILVLSAAGVGWVSLTRHPVVRYWDVVAVVVAVVAVVEGWDEARESGGRWRLIWTQALHWGAFLVAMNLVFLPSMTAVLTTDALSLTVLLLLALGTFVSGVHTLSPLMAANGVFMAVCVPAIAWVDHTALVVVLVLVVLAAVLGLFLWLRHRNSDQSGPQPAG